MKALLMHRDRDFGLDEGHPSNTADLTRDLELDTLLHAMAGGDEFLLEVAKKAVLGSLRGPEEVLYRQRVLADCQERPDVARDLYAIAVEAIEREKRVWGWMSPKHPESTLYRSVEVLQIFVGLIRKLRRIADTYRDKFHSDGFRRFFNMLSTELNDEYLHLIEGHLERLQFRNGTLIGAELGQGNMGANYVLRKPSYIRRSWIDRIQGWLEQAASKDGQELVYEVHERDDAGFRALSDLRGRGIRHVATALAQSTDHILGFFHMLRLELGFYVSCLNLRDQLVRKRGPLCFPRPLPADRPMLACEGLYDVCLRLRTEEGVVGNDVAADDMRLIMITGANRGGKSSFLRSVGLAQLMMQCGMFVAAKTFAANLCDGIFTHFKREEDAGMNSGKLDEELGRMSAIVDKIAPRSIVLFNESFASTNEREGSEIARRIVRGLLEAEVKVFYVTHMFDLAHGLSLAKSADTVFLRAERLGDGRRTFRLVPGEPLPTSHGEDLYRSIFGGSPTPRKPENPVGPGEQAAIWGSPDIM